MTNTNTGILAACGILCLYPLLSAALGIWLWERYKGGAFRRRG
jgi:hypothetical protein